jgi:hypothetical protein
MARSAGKDRPGITPAATLGRAKHERLLCADVQLEGESVLGTERSGLDSLDPVDDHA